MRVLIEEVAHGYIDQRLILNAKAASLLCINTTK